MYKVIRGLAAGTAFALAGAASATAATGTFSDGGSLWEFGTFWPGENEYSSVQAEARDLTTWDGTGEVEILSIVYYNAVNGGNPANWVETLEFKLSDAERAHLAGLGLDNFNDFQLDMSIQTTSNAFSLGCGPNGCPDILNIDVRNLPSAVSINGELSIEVAEKTSSPVTLFTLTRTDPPSPPPPPSPVPLPAGAWLLLGAVAGLTALGRRKPVR